MRLGKYDKCEEILDDALDIADDLDNERGKIEVYNSLGTLYGQRNKIKKAQRNLELSLEILNWMESTEKPIGTITSGMTHYFTQFFLKNLKNKKT